MSRLTLAVAAIAAAQPAHPSPPTDELAIARPMEDVPGIQLNYYDVDGRDVKAVNRSIKERRRAGSAGTEWNVVVSLDKRTEGAACTITGSKVKFNATATLPRLTGEPADGSLLMLWELELHGSRRIWPQNCGLPTTGSKGSSMLLPVNHVTRALPGWRKRP